MTATTATRATRRHRVCPKHASRRATSTPLAASPAQPVLWLVSVGIASPGAPTRVGLSIFLSVDPVPGGSANSYDYAFQDPVNGKDLAGTNAHKCSGDNFFCLDVKSRGGHGTHVSEISAQVNYGDLNPEEFAAGDQIWFWIVKPDGETTYGEYTITSADAYEMYHDHNDSFRVEFILPAGGEDFPSGTKVYSYLYGKNPYGNPDEGYEPLDAEQATIHS